MLIAFPCDYFDHRQPDEFYAVEYDLSDAANCNRLLIDFDKVLEGCDPFGDIEGNNQLLVWRGWQMPVPTYASFCANAQSHEFVPVSDVDAYSSCHELEQAYALCSDFMVPTAFVPTTDVDNDRIEQVFEELGCERLFVKDLVKGAYDYPCMLDRNRPREWNDEIGRLMRDRGEALSDVIVFKSWVNGFCGETRFFVVDGEICCVQGHAGGTGDVPVRACQAVIDGSGIARASRFFTIDMAFDAQGSPFVVETGDGQVSECDENQAKELFEALANMR